MSSIHAASQQMLQNMEHLNSGKRTLKQVMHQNAEIAEQNKTTAAAISGETIRLQDTIRGLGRLLNGARA
jgi:methyl-accepting chemotaxis protein